MTTAAFDEPLPELAEPPPELRADELRADELRLFDALDLGRLRALDLLAEAPLRDALLFEPLLFEVLRFVLPLFDAALRLPLPDALLVFGLDPFELRLELFRLVPDFEFVWAIFPPWSNAPLYRLTPYGIAKTHWVGPFIPCDRATGVTTLPGIDFTLFKAVNDFAGAHDGLVEDPLRFWALNAQYGFAALLAALFFLTGKWRSLNGRHGVVAAGFSALLALGIAHILADIWVRPRPYDAHPGAHLFIAPSADSSFPSDHATAAFAIAVALLLRHRRAGWIALAMATIVSVSRVAVGTHYPGDVAAGAAIGAAVALVFWHPSVREPLRRLAEFSGRVYDDLIGHVRIRTAR